MGSKPGPPPSNPGFFVHVHGRGERGNGKRVAGNGLPGTGGGERVAGNGRFRSPFPHPVTVNVNETSRLLLAVAPCAGSGGLEGG